MLIHPVSEKNASSEILQEYSKIKTALGTPILPIFFTFLGAFPEYLSYIGEQLEKNLNDSSFISLNSQIIREVNNQIDSTLVKSKDTVDWINLYQSSPSFYYFQKDLVSISETNLKLSFIFIALREAVKGWAVAAKRLVATTESKFEQRQEEIPKEDFVFDLSILKNYENVEDQAKSQSDRLPAGKETSLVKQGQHALEKNLLVEYLKIINSDFKNHMKHEYFWTLRVQLEEKLLNTLANLPHLIYSPYNVIVELTKKYDNFYELIYLLSESFPTLVMQRLMFSCYMIVG